MNPPPIVTLTVLLSLMSMTARGTNNENLTKTVNFYAVEIRKVVDPNAWAVQVNPASIVIESKFNVSTKRRISPSLGEKLTPIKYRIELRFKPKLSKDDYVKLAKKRIEHATIMHYGAKTKEMHSNSLKFLRENPLPRYSILDRVGKPYSIYRFTSDSIAISIAPIEKYAEVKGIEARVDQILWPKMH